MCMNIEPHSVEHIHVAMQRRKDAWNILDLVVVVISVISIFSENLPGVSVSHCLYLIMVTVLLAATPPYVVPRCKSAFASRDHVSNGFITVTPPTTIVELTGVEVSAGLPCRSPLQAP